MGEIHNLRRVRKAKIRADSEKQAAENRIRFGRSKAERESVTANAALDARRLDAHQRSTIDERESEPD